MKEPAPFLRHDVERCDDASAAQRASTVTRFEVFEALLEFLSPGVIRFAFRIVLVGYLQAYAALVGLTRRGRVGEAQRPVSRSARMDRSRRRRDELLAW